MKKKIGLIAGIIIGVLFFSAPPVKEFIALSFLKITGVGIEAVKIEPSTTQPGAYAVPTEAVITNQKGVHTVLKVSGNLTGKEYKEDVLSVTLLSEQDGTAIIKSDKLAPEDRLVVQKKLYEKYKGNR